MGHTIFNTPLITPVAHAVSKFVLRLLGWRVVGEVPPHVKKFVGIVAPHTSNWDFPIFLMVAFALRLNPHWMGKHTLFRFPFHGVMSWLGGIPVNRQIRGDMVAKATDMFLANETFALGISPEGTRKATERWHTGFWYIAQNAQVPILLAFVDYRAKQSGIHGEFHPTDDVEADMRRIKEFYANFEGRNPHNFRI